MRPALRIKKRFADERGSVLIELAFTMPIVAILFLVAIDVGLLVREYQILQNAAREGARFSALPQNQVYPANPGATITAIKDFVVQYAAQEKITISSGNVTVNQVYPINITGGVTYGSEVTVTYTRPFLTIGLPLLPLGSLQLTGRSVFGNLYGS
jgi:Flp pilus assembly protein TadG